MGKTKYSVSKFDIEGKLVDVAINKKGRIKYLKLTTSEGKCKIKPAKKIRDDLDKLVIPGCWLAVEGKRKENQKTGKVKLKASAVELIKQSENGLVKPEKKEKASDKQKSTKPQVKALICKKSNCWEKGGKDVYQKFKEICRDRNLEEVVQLKTTGCQGKCKKAPNLVMLPAKDCLTKVKPQQVSKLLEKHLTS